MFALFAVHDFEVFAHVGQQSENVAARLEVCLCYMHQFTYTNDFTLCSLGLSWLSSKLVAGPNKAWPIMEGLKATSFGLGQVDCANMFPCSISTKYEN